MSILEFIFGIIVTVLIALTIIGAICTKYDTEKLENENEKLKQELYEIKNKTNSKKVGGKRNAKK